MIASLFSGFFSGIFGSFFKFLSNGMLQSIGWQFGQVGSLLQNNTAVTIGHRYANLLHLDAIMCAYVGVFILLIAAGRAALSGNLSTLFHDVLRVMVAIISSFFLVLTIPILESIIHAFSAVVSTSFAGTSDPITHLGQIMTSSLSSQTGNVALIFSSILFVGLVFFAIMFLWIVLMVAQAIVYLAAFFFPLSLALSPKWGRRVAELGGAFLVTPFLITSSLAVALAVFADGPNFGTTFEHVIMGAGMLYVASFSPFFAHKMIHSGASAVANMRSPADHVMSHAQGLAGAAGGSYASSGSAIAKGATATGSVATAIPGAILAGLKHQKDQVAASVQQVAQRPTPSSDEGDDATPHSAAQPATSGATVSSAGAAAASNGQSVATPPPQRPTTPGSNPASNNGGGGG